MTQYHGTSCLTHHSLTTSHRTSSIIYFRSGKTYSITGGPERYEDRGILPRALSLLFEQFDKRKEEGGVQYCCYVSYLELYNENGYDLLARDLSQSGGGGGGGGDGRSSSLLSSMTGSRSGSSSSNEIPKVTMMEDEDGNYHFRNLSVHPVTSEEEALNLLFLGDTNRAIGETEMNQSSSRSHCIFTVMIEARRSGSDTVVRSKLNIVDLAGSERVHKTSSTGQTLSEAKYINSSLFFLEMVIVALHERTKRGKTSVHVPYRNSMMTSVLRDSLGGNCRTVMIATISPEAAQVAESISTCQFAQRVALVKNRAEINEEVEPAVVIRRLRGEVGRLREEVRFLKGENGEGEALTQEEMEDLETRVKVFVEDRGDGAELDLGTITLTKIQAAHAIFKRMVLEERKRGGDTISGSGTGDDQALANRECSNRTDASLQEQVNQLEKTLQRRDHEIAILVDMVKQKGLARRASRQVSHLFTEQRDDDAAEIESSAANVAAGITANEMVCGVERCNDKSVLDEPSKAFDWFKVRYPGVVAIDENKEVLKIKYQEAKDLGEAVQKRRSTINHHKASIDQLRHDQGMRGLSSSEELDADGTAQPHPDEIVHLEAIEREKKYYKDGFSKLRELKGQIEHIQQLVEKNRGAMQKDFDIWYRSMCGERQESVGAYGRMAHASHSGSSGVAAVNSRSRPSFTSLSNKGRSERRHSELYSPGPPRRNSTAELLKIEEERKGDEDQEEEEDDFELPAGVKLTGNKDVDDDIIAFYKAKAELMARSK